MSSSDPRFVRTGVLGEIRGDQIGRGWCRALEDPLGTQCKVFGYGLKIAANKYTSQVGRPRVGGFKIKVEI